MQAESLEPEEIANVLLKEGVDAVIAVALVDKEKSVNYNHGTSTYMYGGYEYGFWWILWL